MRFKIDKDFYDNSNFFARMFLFIGFFFVDIAFKINNFKQK